MSSYQDLDSRLKVVEDKLDFVMRSFSVVTRTPTLLEGHDLMEKKTFLDLYYEQQTHGPADATLVKLN